MALDQVNLVPLQASTIPGDSVLNLASPGPSEYALHLQLIWTWYFWFYLGITGTWLLYSTLGLT